MNTVQLAFLAALIATIIWGATPPIAKLTFTEMPPFVAAFLRFVMATILILPILGFQSKLSKVKIADYPLMFVLSLLGITLSIGLFFVGLNLTSAMEAGIIISTGPLFNAVAAKLILKEKVSFLHWLGISLASVGTLVIIVIAPFVEKNISTNYSLLGNLLLLLAVLAGTGFNILSKESFKKFDSSTIIGFSFTIGAFTFLPFALWENAIHTDWILNLTINGLLGLLYLGIFASLCAYLLYEWSLEKLPISKTLPMTFLQPVVTVVVAVPLLGEKITPTFIVGSVLILLGMFLGTYNFPHHHQRAAHHKV